MRRRLLLFTPTTVLLVAYGAMLACGLLALLADPSPTVRRQGGNTFATVLAVVYVAAGALAIVGRLRKRPLIELLGAGLAATASLVWTGALVAQAVNNHDRAPLTAACIGLALTALFAYRIAVIERR